MKSIAALLIVLTSMYPVFAPESTSQEHVIARMIETGTFEGHDQKVIGPMGDAAGVIVTKVVSGKPLTSSQIDAILVVLQGAFADPRMIENLADRQPRTTLFVLSYLTSATHEPDLQKRIAEATKYIQDHYLEAVRDIQQK